jgi:hypothetical protein
MAFQTASKLAALQNAMNFPAEKTTDVVRLSPFISRAEALCQRNDL